MSVYVSGAICGYCGRPISGQASAIGNAFFHPACTQPPKAEIGGFTRTPIGCICPPTSEQTCQRADCPRKESGGTT